MSIDIEETENKEIDNKDENKHNSTKNQFAWRSEIIGAYGSNYAEIDKYILNTLAQRAFTEKSKIKYYIACGDIKDKAKEYVILANDTGEALVKVAKSGNELFDALLKDYFIALDQSFDQWEEEDYSYRPTVDQLLEAIENAPSLDMDTYLIEVKIIQ